MLTGRINVYIKAILDANKIILYTHYVIIFIEITNVSPLVRPLWWLKLNIRNINFKPFIAYRLNVEIAHQSLEAQLTLNLNESSGGFANGIPLNA